MSANATSTTAPTGTRFFPVALDSLDDSTLEMDLYLQPKEGAGPVLYRSTGVRFTPEDRKRLVRQRVKYVYVPVRQHAIYRKVLGERLDKLFRDPKASRAERARVIRAACTKMIEDVLLFPGRIEMIESVRDISKRFAIWSEHDSSTFSYFLDMSRHDYYTATHMVNVGVGCGLLAKEIRPEDLEFQSQIMQGGLLHDIGKRAVPEEILNKEGKLEPAEWEKIQAHPLIGYHELQEQPHVPDLVLSMVRDHHERLDGNGYPYGRSGDNIGEHVRLCTIVDAFDAICSTRPYRGPTPPRDTLKIMLEGAEGTFDLAMLEQWSALVERLIAEDPKRAVPSMGTETALTLDDLVQVVATKGDPRALHEPQDERRRHPRCPYPAMVNAVILHQAEPGRARIGEVIQLQAIDISQGGMKLRVPWPMSIADAMALELPMKNGRSIRRQANVVYCHKSKDSDEHWLIGLQFAEG